MKSILYSSPPLTPCLLFTCPTDKIKGDQSLWSGAYGLADASIEQVRQAGISVDTGWMQHIGTCSNEKWPLSLAHLQSKTAKG